MKDVKYTVSCCNKLPALLCVVILLFSFLLSSCGNKSGNLGKEERRFFDDCDYLTEQEYTDLDSRAVALCEKYGFDFVFLIAEIDTNGLTEDYSEYFLEYNQFKSDCVMVFLDMYNRTLSVVALGKASEVYTQSFISEIKNNYSHCLTDGEYYSSFSGIMDELNKK